MSAMKFKTDCLCYLLRYASVAGVIPATFAFVQLGLGASNLLQAQTVPIGPYLDANGWTVFTPSADTRIIYVSKSTGKDSNPGHSDTPVKTIAKGTSLLRRGHPDWLLLKKGDTWTNETLQYLRVSGRSATEPMLISSYGTGARPLLRTNTSGDAVAIGSLRAPFGDFLALTDIEFYAYTSDPNDPNYAGSNTTQVGARFLAPVTWLLIENCKFSFYSTSIVFDVSSAPTSSKVTVRRNIVADDWSATSHSQGMYADGIPYLLIEDNLFDHNGWNTSVAGGDDTVFNHNVYVKENITNFVARNNIFANASSHGLQARGGGEVIDNLFLYNPLGMEFGFVNGSPMTPGGVMGTISSNVFEGSRDIAGSPRGLPVQIGNTKPGASTSIRNNIIIGDNQNAFAGINLSVGSGITNPTDAVGINDLIIENNIVFKWHSAITFDSDLVAGGTGISALNNVIIRNNDFQLPLSGVLVYHSSRFQPNQEHWSNNRYYSGKSQSSWFTLGNTSTSLDLWRSTVEPTAMGQQVTSYPDSNRTVETYNAHLGGSPSLATFLTEARKQNKDHWRVEYTASVVNNYIRSGFGIGPASYR